MVTVQNILGPAPFPTPIAAAGSSSTLEHLSILSWNVLLPNSQDGWYVLLMSTCEREQPRGYLLAAFDT